VHNKMFAQWCGDVLPKVYIFVPRFGVGDRTRLRNRTTAQTQTLCAIQNKMVTRLFNIIAIGSLLTFIFFFTSFFFLGSIETFDRQVVELPEYFFKRSAAGVVIGILGCIVVAVGNFLFDKGQRSDKKARILRIILWTMLLSVITSVVGTAIFFYH